MRARVPIAIVLVLVAIPLAALAAQASMSPVVSAKLTGGAEAPKKGPSAGKGTAVIHLNATKATACWSFKNVSGLGGTPTAAHIHKGGKGKAGPVAVPFGGTYKASGCQKSTKAAIEAIESHPDQYYVNIHTARYPDGAVRGQLVAGMIGG